mgnify:CR=1 FL=1
MEKYIIGHGCNINGGQYIIDFDTNKIYDFYTKKFVDYLPDNIKHIYKSSKDFIYYVKVYE